MWQKIFVLLSAVLSFILAFGLLMTQDKFYAGSIVALSVFDAVLMSWQYVKAKSKDEGTLYALSIAAQALASVFIVGQLFIGASFVARGFVLTFAVVVMTFGAVLEFVVFVTLVARPVARGWRKFSNAMKRLSAAMSEDAPATASANNEELLRQLKELKEWKEAQEKKNREEKDDFSFYDEELDK